MKRIVAVAAFAVLLVPIAGCASHTQRSPSSPRSTVTEYVAPSSPTTSSAAPVTPPPTTPAATTTEALPVVTEGALCASRGAVAVFADGAAAYCARLQGTDGGAWSRDPDLAPNPALSQAQTPSAPGLGDSCIGADIGRTATDANGTAIVCDNYQWVPNTGQTPRHPWADDQREWTDCLQTHSADECREILGTN
ncbi:hypothetical protein ACPXB3_12645 [Gordonia sp. DT219]|uniref:hypothetical protein n=1 Tax=Gordonia sp. DT219 TaxID=3416658 RepID=UPI003CEE26F8